MKIKIDDYWELNSVLREVQKNARVRVILSPEVHHCGFRYTMEGSGGGYSVN